MSNNKTIAKEILRWCVIAASGVYGLWQLFEAGCGIIQRWNGGWFSALFLLLFPMIIAVPCFRRIYLPATSVSEAFSCAWVCRDISHIRRIIAVARTVGHQ
jgi:hypothetical protein